MSAETMNRLVISTVDCPRFYSSKLKNNSLQNYPLYSTDETDDLTSGSSDSLTINMSENRHMRNNANMYREDERIKTFANWPLDWLDKHLMALTGLYYIGEEDKVKCYFCEVEIGRWERTDHPVNEHLRWSGLCPLLRRRNTNNVPIDADKLNSVLPAVSYDTCGLNGQAITHQEEPSTPDLRPASSCVPTLANNTYAPQYPDYVLESARERSFAEWPRNMKPKPKELAEAGFFYTGTGDRVKCFSCGGGLKDWDDNDKPWEQHALWLSKCRYLKLMKGDLFIDEVIARQIDRELRANLIKGEEQSLSEPMDKSPAASSETALQMAVESSETPTPTTLVNGNLMKDSIGVSKNVYRVMLGEASTENNEAAESKCETPVERSARAAGVAEKKSHSTIPEEKLCKICYECEYNTAFLPCGHVVACAKCASSVTKCPVCRKPFSDVMRVFFS